MFTYQSYLGQNYPVASCSDLGSNTYGPMNSTSTANSKNRTAFILPNSSINFLDGGNITSVFFKRSSTTGALNAGTTFKIYLKDTMASNFGATSLDWAAEVATATLVYDSDPQSAVGSTDGWKQFNLTSSFPHASGSNLAVFVEYVQATGQASTISWNYEYTSPCVNTAVSTSTKYTNTTGTLSNSLSSENYRRPLIGFNATFPPATTVPNCTTVSEPAANATNISLNPTFTWSLIGGVNGATSYVINLGTTPGGTDVMNGVDVGNVTTYTLPASNTLNFGVQYYYTIIAKNSIGNAVGCAERSFTTKNIGCPTVTAPASNELNVSLTPTITWTAVADATGYRLTVGTSQGASDIMNNVDLGNVTSYTFTTPLNNSTKYYYTLNAYTSTSNSTSCTERAFTTVCIASTAPYTENFDMTSTGSSSNNIAPICWTYLETASSDGYGYVTSSTTAPSSPNNFYLYNSSASSGNIMLVSPETTALSDGTKRVRFFAKAGSSGYALQVGTVSNVSDAASFTAINTVTLSSSWTQYIVDIPVGTDLRVAFRHGLGGTYRSLYIDDVSVESIPGCVEPTAVVSSSVTYKSAVISWTASGSAPNGNYDVYISTSNTPPTSTTVPHATNVTSPYTLTPLNPSTTYYVWVRSNCVTSTSPWAPLPSLTTLSFCPSVTAPTNNATNVSLTPTITWSAVTNATGYRITMGTTSGGTDVMNNVDVGNVLTYTLPTPLNNSTSYFYTVNAYDAEVTSQSCTVRIFNTVCGTPLVPAYSNNFDAFPGACWSVASGGSPATGSTGTTAYWAADGFLNNGTTGAIRYNAFTTDRQGWIKSVNFDLSAGGYRVKFDYGLTTFGSSAAAVLGSDDVVQFIVSQDGGTTWTVLQTWNASTPITNTSNAYSLDLTGYNSANTIFAFYGSNGDVNNDEDVNFYVDNFVVEPASALSTTENIKKNNLKAYPNPFADVLNISDISNVKSISVVDVSGKLVKSFNKPESVLHLRELNSGMYLVILHMKDGSRQTIKAIKK